MEKQNSHIDEVIMGYLTGNATLKEKRLLKEWIGRSEENRCYFQRMVSLWTSVAQAGEDGIYDQEKAFCRFKERTRSEGLATAALRVQTPSEAQEAPTGRKRTRPWHWHRNWVRYIARYAAAVLVLIGFSFYFYNKGETSVKTAFSDIVIEVPLGSSTRMVLPDGTEVWLNAGSRIAYSQGFGVDDRRVRLEGEGYFEVTPNAKLPFFVDTEDLNVEVLGTKFNFRNYEYDADAVVTLLDGKVLLTNQLRDEASITLMPDNRVVLNKKEGRMIVENIHAVDAREWTNGYLFFNEEQLSDIARRLERTYGVKIVIASDSLSSIRFYGGFVKQEQNIHDVMDALSATGKFRYRIEGHEVTVY